jgi:hypothetical protein
MYLKVNFSQLSARLSDSIKSIYSSNNVLKEIEHLNPVYAGGFPMGLLFAPRERDGSISSYYSDYDIYFQDPDNCERAQDLIRSSAQNYEQFSTENAETIVTWDEDRSVNNTYQIVTKFNYSPEDVVDTFDFTNCAIAFTPADGVFTSHTTTIKDHLNKTLNIHNPWMLQKLLDDELTEQQVATYACVQISRFKKYCRRWDYTLSDTSWKKLIQVYEKFPNIVSYNNIPMVIDFGAYSGFNFVVRRNQNVWEAMKELLSNNSMFPNYNDQHSILKQE